MEDTSLFGRWNVKTEFWARAGRQLVEAAIKAAYRYFLKLIAFRIIYSNVSKILHTQDGKEEMDMTFQDIEMHGNGSDKVMKMRRNNFTMDKHEGIR